MTRTIVLAQLPQLVGKPADRWFGFVVREYSGWWQFTHAVGSV